MKTNINDLTLKLHLIPGPVAIDVMKRIIDWTSSGGSYNDEYIKRQINFALSFIKED